MTRSSLVIADKKGNIFDVPRLEATGMKAGEYFRLKRSDLIELHPDSELFMLPARRPVGYDPSLKEYVTLRNDPFSKKKEPCFSVAAFLAPGYTATLNASYRRKGGKRLPLFSYAAAAFYKGRFYAAAMRVDREKRQELSGMKMEVVLKNVKAFRKIFPKNRLVRHLENCALCYGCPAAKNFFLKRYEGPLPTSPSCNAMCLGCISYQPRKSCPVTQPRIKFVPSAEEIAEVALFHLGNVKDPVVSFGQGCEGEPLMVADIIENAVKMIRRKTKKGIININTNASMPASVQRLFDAGMDSMRVSINSFREKYYSAYYLPRGYGFKDVVDSIKRAKGSGGFVSINYLVMPGFTDSENEAGALFGFLKKGITDMIQWRNLNYDPLDYFKKLNIIVKRGEMMGMDVLVKRTKKQFPKLMHGYFNPSRTRIKRNK